MATAGPPIDPALIQRGLECPVCHESYRRPRILPCGHTFCQTPCLEQVINDKPRVSCPECRSEHAVSESGASGFMMNVAISRLTEESSESRQVLSGCPICSEDVHLVKCLHCDLDICEECKTDHTPKFRQKLREELEEFQEEINWKRTACANLGTTLKEDVKVATDLVSGDIEKASEELIQTIVQKSKLLKQKVKKFVEDEYESINYQTEEGLRHLAKAAEFCEAERRELHSHGRLSHMRLSKIQNDYRENNSAVSKRRRVMTVRRHISFHSKPVSAEVEDFGDVVIGQDNLSQKEEKIADADKVLFEIRTLIEQTFTTPQLSIGSAGNGPEHLCEPIGVAVHPGTKDVFVTDTKNHRVQVFDRNGHHKLSFGSEGRGNMQFMKPSGITISRKGHVVVSDQCNHRVKIHRPDGSFVRAFGQTGADPGEFSFPFGVAQDPDENIHVCDIVNKRVQIFTESGTFINEYNSWEPTAKGRPWNISITETGQIGVQLDRAIVILNDKRQLLHHFLLDVVPMGICFLGDNHLHLTENAHKIRLYTSTGDLIRESGVPGSGVGHLQDPRGIAINGTDVYVVCQGSSVVQKF